MRKLEARRRRATGELSVNCCPGRKDSGEQNRRMGRRIALWAAVPALAAGIVSAQQYGLGRSAGTDEIAAWDITIGPQGKGLPHGAGAAREGAQVYEVRCKECHGEAGAGGDQVGFVGKPEQLVGEKTVRNVGSFWPYATTLFDYTRRAMPFDRPGTLTDDQIYAVTAYILYLNGIVGEDETMDAETLPQVKMPNRGGFIRDPRRKP